MNTVEKICFSEAGYGKISSFSISNASFSSPGCMVATIFLFLFKTAEQIGQIKVSTVVLW